MEAALTPQLGTRPISLKIVMVQGLTALFLFSKTVYQKCNGARSPISSRPKVANKAHLCRRGLSHLTRSPFMLARVVPAAERSAIAFPGTTPRHRHFRHLEDDLPWRTTFAPILINFSRNVVNVH